MNEHEGNGRARATLEDVAREAGVSRATASRAIRGGELVSATNRVAVQQAVDRLGYVPNLAARSLVTRQTDTIAVVVPERDDKVFSDPFIAATIGGIADVLADAGKQVVLLMRSRRRGNEQLARYLLGGHVDGVVIVSHHRDEQLAKEIARAALPTVFIGRPLEEELRLPYVDLDNVAGGRLAAERLIASGMRHPAIITGPLDMVAALDRLAGWGKAIRAAGLNDALRYESDFTMESAYHLAHQLFQEHPEVDGLFAANDLVAVGVMNAARDLGRVIPDDVAVVGFDATPLGLSTLPRLTTITNPAGELARLATHMVLQQIVGETPTWPLIVTPELVARESA